MGAGRVSTQCHTDFIYILKPFSAFRREKLCVAGRQGSKRYFIDTFFHLPIEGKLGLKSVKCHTGCVWGGRYIFVLYLTPMGKPLCLFKPVVHMEGNLFTFGLICYFCSGKIKNKTF